MSGDAVAAERPEQRVERQRRASGVTIRAPSPCRRALRPSPRCRYDAFMLIAARCGAASATIARPESYGTFSHLCASVAHESAVSMPVDLRSQFGNRRRPEAERAVDVHPRAARVRASSTIAPSGSLAPVLTLPACAQTIVGPSRPCERGVERVRAHAALIVDGDELDLLGAEPEIPQRADRGDVHFVAGDHAHARRALQAVRLDVPAGAAQHFVPRRRQAGEVRHVAAGDEADAGVARAGRAARASSRRRCLRSPQRPATCT